ncbi:hypothetical protein [Gluconobacter morbifer]|uniref:Lipoprotein n=1 Tax=Gluconobacter morbifer G707 TaxID=1088869 RepID=G6XMC9_9PROT|nr:hypothetical protein [Gluconobacter morbifer]EHH67027.1 hypothetical protein GMO_26470 [Gluconobacter morbifer G707]
MGLRYWAGAAVLAFSLGLAGCSGDSGTQTFPPADYSYLSTLHLNVANINIQDEAVPAPGSLSSKAPTPPDQALKTMATQRLMASGASGKADFIIRQAYIEPAGGNAISGALDVQLNVADANNQHTGYIHARITRKLDAGDRDPTSRAELYDLTNRMMQDMNVELEFQIRKKLLNWMTDATGNPLVGGGVQQQTLGAPGTEPAAAVPAASPAAGSTTATTPSITMPVVTTPDVKVSTPDLDQPSATTNTAAPSATAPTEPDAIFPTGGEGSEEGGTTTTSSGARQHSPAPGTLQLPSATQGSTSGQ